MQKNTKIQASVQHGLYLFTCEIHSFNSISIQLPPYLRVDQESVHTRTKSGKLPQVPWPVAVVEFLQIIISLYVFL